MGRSWMLPLITLLGMAGCGGQGAARDGATVSIRVAGMVKAQGITWLGWPNKVQAALEGLPGVKKLTVDLADDRFDVQFDPRKTTVERVLAEVRTLGFSPSVVEKPESASKPAEERVDLASLPQDLRQLFAQARKEGSLVLLDFYAPGWGACEEMDTVTYPDPEVRKELSRWAVAKINVAERPEVARAFGVPAVPTAVCVDPSGAVLAKLPDFISPETFEKRLHDIRNARWWLRQKIKIPSRSKELI